MSAITLEDPRLLTPIPDILAFLRGELSAVSDEDVFIKAFENNQVSEGRAAYRIFVAGGCAYLPPSVQCEYLKHVPLATP